MRRLTALVVTCVILLSVCAGTAFAADDSQRNDNTVGILRASDYLLVYDAWTSKAGSGSLRIEFTVTATKQFPSVGALQIIVQEKNGTSWTGVKTYYSATTSGMIGNNTNSYSSGITHPGTPGKEYRALVTVYAGSSTGSDQQVVTTNSTVV